MRGIEETHGKACAKRADPSRRCSRKGCSFRGYLYNPALATKSKMERGPRFPSIDEAKTWRANRVKELELGLRRAPTSVTLEQAWTKWHNDAKAGVLLTRSGQVYKPKTLRSYHGTMRNNVLPKHGNLPLSSVTREGLQRLIGRMNGERGKGTRGNSPATVRNTINALRVLFRDAEHLVPGGINPDPTVGLRLPSVQRKTKRRVTVAEAGELIAALPEHDRPVWATFFYSGLRVGEVQGLRWQDVDFDADELHVVQGWDAVDGAITPKSSAGQRTVPMPAVLKGYLEAQRDGRPDRKPHDLVFGRPDGRPFNPQSITQRADRTWKAADPPLARITPHDCRHAYAALMIAAGASLTALSEYMGHSDIHVTNDEYAYLLKGTRDADGKKLDALIAAG